MKVHDWLGGGVWEVVKGKRCEVGSRRVSEGFCCLGCKGELFSNELDVGRVIEFAHQQG